MSQLVPMCIFTRRIWWVERECYNGERRVVREIPLDQHKTHAHPAEEIENISNEVYYTLVSTYSDRSRLSSVNLVAYSRKSPNRGILFVR